MSDLNDWFFSGCPDLTIRSDGCEVHYMDTSTSEKVSYELSGVTLFGACPDCKSLDLLEMGSYLKCMNCKVRLTMENVESRIIASG